MKSRDWEAWLIVDSEYKPDDYAGLGNFPDREDTSPKSGDRFVVVMPFCVRDIHLALKLAKWMTELGPYDHEILISHDYLTSPAAVDNVAKELTKAFPSVKVFGYSAPRPEHWPPTIAFREAANKMQQVGKPWLWLECDCVPLKKGWLDKLQQLYWNFGKAFAGPIVKDMGHMNGTGIYPANTPKRIPRALSMTRTAWDVTMMVEMIHDCANLHPYWFHAWGTQEGKLHPYLGEPPVFRDSKLVSQIPEQSVIFHRDKSLSLIDRLRETNTNETWRQNTNHT